MKCAGKILICLTGGLVFNTSLRADDVVLPGNPYAPVVVRNIFGLNPPPVFDPNASTAQPPVKITPNGIMSIFGELQVLFKVGGKPPGQDAYTLSEGEQQDDIEVVKIDEKAGVVTFNNHGIVQALPLVAATASSGPAPASTFATGSHAMPRIAPGGSGGNTGANGFMNSFGNRVGNLPVNNGNGGGNPGNNNGPTLGNVPTHSNTFNAASQIPDGMTPEIQPIMIEANRLAAQQSGDTEAASILPVTELTPTPSDSVSGGNSSQPQ
jgi:hypothetical protein